MLICPDTLPAALVDCDPAASSRRVLYASPLHFERLGNLAPGEPLASVRLALSTSAPITPAVMERFAVALRRAGRPGVRHHRGGPALHQPARRTVCRRTSVGRPVARLRGGGARRRRASAAARRTVGEIAVRGDGLFSAYYAPWRLREHVTRDGWFLTGDIGWLDESGALYLKGRKTAVIFVAGLKFFPEEVEECINQFPGVTESRVFGRAHARLGEVPCAEIAARRRGCDLEALKAHCARALSPYKVPGRVAELSRRSRGRRAARSYGGRCGKPCREVAPTIDAPPGPAGTRSHVAGAAAALEGRAAEPQHAAGGRVRRSHPERADHARARSLSRSLPVARRASSASVSVG